MWLLVDAVDAALAAELFCLSLQLVLDPNNVNGDDDYVVFVTITVAAVVGGLANADDE